MKLNPFIFLIVFLPLLIGGCITANQPKWGDIELIVNRIEALEKQQEKSQTDLTRVKSGMKINSEVQGLNESQKDFVKYMLEYLADK